jgi:hypothetical protein
MILVRDMENRILFLEKKCYGGLRILRWKCESKKCGTCEE